MRCRPLGADLAARQHLEQLLPAPCPLGRLAAHPSAALTAARRAGDRDAEGLTLARAIGDRGAEAYALCTLGDVRRRQGRLKEAASCLIGRV